MIEFLYFGIKFSKAFVEILSLEDKNKKNVIHICYSVSTLRFVLQAIDLY